MSRAVRFHRYGPPEVLVVDEVEPPVPEHGQIRVAVRAAGVQPFDVATRRGDFRQYRALRLPSGLGNEVAGVVDLVGEGTAGFAVGDEVIAYLDLAGYADQVVVAADSVVRRPAAMRWDEAGGLSVSGQTASTALDALDLTADDVLLVHAAAGGVGGFAVQLARATGATVLGTASPAHHAYLTSLGAIPVDYHGDVVRNVNAVAPAPVTKVLDCIGGDALDASLALVGSARSVKTVADWTRAAQLGIERVGTDRSQARLQALADLYRLGRLSIEVSNALPLDQVVSAHRVVETGHGRGKTVLLP